MRINQSSKFNVNYAAKIIQVKDFTPCHNDVPHEGIVIRIENGLSEAYKLKCFRFLGEESKSLNKGEIDIEADQ